jgi:integral membrane sensor domain MASE1
VLTLESALFHAGASWPLIALAGGLALILVAAIQVARSRA